MPPIRKAILFTSVEYRCLQRKSYPCVFHLAIRPVCLLACVEGEQNASFCSPAIGPKMDEGMSFSDLGRVHWGPTGKLARASGIATSAAWSALLALMSRAHKFFIRRGSWDTHDFYERPRDRITPIEIAKAGIDRR